MPSDFWCRLGGSRTPKGREALRKSQLLGFFSRAPRRKACGKAAMRLRGKGVGNEDNAEGKKIPDETLMRVCCDLFGWNSFDEEVFRETVDQITAVYPNNLVFHLKDGTEKTAEWHYVPNRSSVDLLKGVLGLSDCYRLIAVAYS